MDLDAPADAPKDDDLSKIRRFFRKNLDWRYVARVCSRRTPVENVRGVLDGITPELKHKPAREDHTARMLSIIQCMRSAV